MVNRGTELTASVTAGNKLSTSERLSTNKRLSIKTPAVDPVFLRAFLDEGQGLLRAGRDADALEIAKRAIRLDETTDSKRFFVRAVRGWRSFPEADEFRDVIGRAWREAWGTPADLLGITKGLLETNGVLTRALERAARAWPARVPLGELFGTQDLVALSGDALMLAVLESDKIIDLDLERLLTSVRAGLLDALADADESLPPDALPFCCALARQCFINEYIWDTTDGETEAVARLNERLAHSIRTREAVSPFVVAVAAAYGGLDGAQALLKRPWPHALAELLNQQLREPAEWRRSAASIPRLTAIGDATSIAVKSQYEENPYPRWVRLTLAEPPAAVDEGFQTHFPFSPFRKLGKTAAALDLLIAGCGTGHHALLFAKGFPGANILAIDLSLASLGYAQHKTRELGLRNIHYGQADILELGTLGRTFDMISSSGVLHHLADPLHGWRQLLSLLRPDGLMHVGLYSECARRNLAVARNRLLANGYSPEQTIGALRRSRQDIIAASNGDAALADVLKLPDFYSMSEYRDLLFHKQEQTFTIPRIARFLDENDLQFIGFNVGDDTLAAFQSRFSRQREADLAAWHEFETGRPATFQGMYQFWVQRH